MQVDKRFYIVLAPGDYDVPEGLVFSMPVRFSKEDGWTLIKDMEISDEYKEQIKTAVEVSFVNIQFDRYSISVQRNLHLFAELFCKDFSSLIRKIVVEVLCHSESCE